MKKSILVGSLLLLGLLVCASYAVEVTLLGPKQYMRTDGAPNVYTDTFPGRVGQGKIIVKNGGVDGTLALSSAIIKVNGIQIFGTSDFSQNVPLIERMVSLLKENSISIELRSKPGSMLTVQVIENIEADGVQVVDPTGGVLEVNEPESPIYGYRVIFPAGALSESTVTSIEYVPGLCIPRDNNKQEGFDLPAFRLLPEDIVLDELATIIVPYQDDDNDGIVDGSNLPVDTGKIFFVRNGDIEFFAAHTLVDESSHTLVTQTYHFSDWVPTFFGRFYGYWTGVPLKYFVESLPGNTTSPPSEFLAEIKQAFDQWSEAIDKKIYAQRVASVYEADFRIVAKDFDTFWFRVRGHKKDPALTYRSIIADNQALVVYFNSGVIDTNQPYRWTTGPYDNFPPDNQYTYFAFLRNALHEFGHVMGLKDYTVPERWIPCNDFREQPGVIMYWDCFQPNAYTTLSDFDISELRTLYGLPQRVTLFFDDFEDGNLNGWYIVDNEVTATTENKKNGNYSMKLYDNSTSPKGTGVQLTLINTTSRISIEFWEWTNDFGYSGGSEYYVDTARPIDPANGWRFAFGAQAYTNNGWKYIDSQSQLIWTTGNPWVGLSRNFPTPVSAQTNSWHKIKIEIFGPEGRARFWYDDQFKGEIVITPTISPLKYFWHNISWSSPIGTINYIDDFKVEALSANDY